MLAVQPCFVFIGAAFESDERFKLAKSMLLDLFRGQEVAEMSLMAISHVYVCSAADPNLIRLRHYAVRLLKSGTKVRPQRRPVSTSRRAGCLTRGRGTTASLLQCLRCIE